MAVTLAIHFFFKEGRSLSAELGRQKFSKPDGNSKTMVSVRAHYYDNKESSSLDRHT